MNNEYDCSWDLVEGPEGNLPANEELFDEKYREWQSRDWIPWFERNLSFPFTAERMEDDDDAYCTDVADHQSFRLHHRMEVLALEFEDDPRGVIVKVQEGQRIGYVPLCDLQVTSKSNKNYWLVREYVVWFANR